MLPYKDMPLFPEKVTLSSNVIEIENVKMKRQRTTFQTKEQDKILGGKKKKQKTYFNKNAHWTQEKNRGQSENLNKKLDKR